jgi:hypothetical protein
MSVLLARYSYDDQIQEGEVSGKCKQRGKKRNAHEAKEVHHYVEIGLYLWILLKLMIRK